jgi:tRNA pseudouridine55 synthase
MQSGVLVLDKPEGPSSAQVVGQVKRILGARKVGHLGTLDPFASGVLPMGVNEGTKVAEILLAAQKSYTGVLALGVETDTQDRTGKVVKVSALPALSEEQIARARTAFTGNLQQTPPMYSALKSRGVRLYRLARRGETVTRPARAIRVERLDLWQINQAEIGFEIVCSKGTYVRTLAADIGSFFGCGAHLKTLRRLSCGALTLAQAVSPDELERLKKNNRVPLIPLSDALSHVPKIPVGADWLPRLRKGQQDMLTILAAPREEETLARLVDQHGNLVALIQWMDRETQAGWRLQRVFGASFEPGESPHRVR